MAKPELLTCPFCGSKPYITTPRHENGWYQIGCDEDNICPATPFVDDKNLEEATELWNKRSK